MSNYIDRVTIGSITKYIQDAAVQSMITVSEESSTTASKAYSIGDFFRFNGVLYKVTAVISSGGTITPNVNCISTSIENELNGMSLEPMANVTAMLTELGLNANANLTAAVAGDSETDHAVVQEG